jgi:hypothetical protein
MRRRAPVLAIIILGVLLASAPFIIGNAARPHRGALARTEAGAVKVRHAPMRTIDEFRKDAEYDYRGKNTPQFSLADWIISRLNELLKKLFGKRFAGLDGTIVWIIIKYTIYLFVALAAIYVLFILAGTDLRGIFISPQKRRIAANDAIEDIGKVDLDELMARYLELRDYRAVVRLMYLKTLKALSDCGLILWKIDKTNYDYLFELAGSPLKKEFAELTRIFEYLWYGNFNIPEEAFAAVRNRYDGFYVMIGEKKNGAAAEL